MIRGHFQRPGEDLSGVRDVGLFDVMNRKGDEEERKGGG